MVRLTAVTALQSFTGCNVAGGVQNFALLRELAR